jgi:hypothetical protein
MRNLLKNHKQLLKNKNPQSEYAIFHSFLAPNYAYIKKGPLVEGPFLIYFIVMRLNFDVRIGSWRSLEV